MERLTPPKKYCSLTKSRTPPPKESRVSPSRTNVGYAAARHYAMSGTDIGYAALRHYAMSGTAIGYAALRHYAMSGTDIGYAATRQPLCTALQRQRRTLSTVLYQECVWYGVSGTDVGYAATRYRKPQSARQERERGEWHVIDPPPNLKSILPRNQTRQSTISGDCAYPISGTKQSCSGNLAMSGYDIARVRTVLRWHYAPILA
eukprot:71904-Rhodomonas_salina.5